MNHQLLVAEFLATPWALMPERLNALAGVVMRWSAGIPAESENMIRIQADRVIRDSRRQAASSVGDYLTPAGSLNVDETAALGLAEHLMDHAFDAAVSRRMTVDHGFAQALQFIWGGLSTPPLIPLFMNAVAQPGIPRLKRCHQLGVALGEFLDTQTRRTLVIGSGGLSHEPPVPTLAHPDPQIRERITLRQSPTPADREAKTRKVMDAGMALASGTSGMKPLNPEWDKNWMDAMASGQVDSILSWPEESIQAQAGLSAHESKTWLIARSALPLGHELQVVVRNYQAIPEYIAGHGTLFIQSR